MENEYCIDCYEEIDECTCDRCDECNEKLEYGHDLDCTEHEYNEEE